MKKALLPSLAFLALTASIASAQYGGIKLAWSDCLGAGGGTNRTFACDTNVGTHDLYVSFEAPQDIPDVNGLNVTIDLNTGDNSYLPAWWQFKNIGSCRQSALSAQTIHGSCASIWGDPSPAISAIAVYYSNAVMPSWDGRWTRILGSVSAPLAAAAPVHPGTEYTAQVIRINNTKTAGVGACNGCEHQICLELIEVLLTTNSSGNFSLQNPGHCGAAPPVDWSFCPCPGVPGTFVTWQGSDTPTLSRTWGQLKSFYR